MASQISHIIYAKKYFEAIEDGTLPEYAKYSLPIDFDRDLFLLGCTFPDIRRIDGTIRRKDTHLAFDVLDLDFRTLDSFTAGWKFHLYCDMRREDILNKIDFYKLPNASDFWNLSSKLLEDRILYDTYNNWEKVMGFFQNPPFIETRINVSRETFELWYAILAKYFERNPCRHSMIGFISKQPSLADIAEDLVDSVDNLQKNDTVIKLLPRVKDEIV